jgi:hypothetical protein
MTITASPMKTRAIHAGILRGGLASAFRHGMQYRADIKREK